MVNTALESCGSYTICTNDPPSQTKLKICKVSIFSLLFNLGCVGIQSSWYSWLASNTREDKIHYYFKFDESYSVVDGPEEWTFLSLFFFSFFLFFSFFFFFFFFFDTLFCLGFFLLGFVISYLLPTKESLGVVACSRWCNMGYSKTNIKERTCGNSRGHQLKEKWNFQSVHKNLMKFPWVLIFGLRNFHQQGHGFQSVREVRKSQGIW